MFSSAEPEFAALYRIYSEAHPPSERKGHGTLSAMIARPEYFFLVVIDDEAVVGFSIANCFVDSDAALLEYMAIDSRHRGRGLGGFVFGETVGFLNLSERFILIEIDSDKAPSADQDQHSRRKAFYRRLGCREIEGLSFIMPRVAEAQPPAMELMVYRRELPASIAKSRIRNWLENCYIQVYQKPRDDRRISAMIDELPVEVRLL